MRARGASMIIAAGAALTLTLTACGGGGDSSGGGSATGTVTVNGSEPQNPLIPANTNETGGGNVLDNVFTGLVKYNPKTAAPEMAVAKSIESSDQITWNITLNEGWTFHDGTPVTADSFIDAWNWGANGSNAALNQYFFEPIEGYDAVSAETAAADAKLTGLTKVNDYAFTVKLSKPNSQFPVMVGYTAFSPLPQSFFADPKAFGENPIGNGPFKFVSWQKNSAINLARFDQYMGTKPSVANATFKIYSTTDAAYADLLANNLDVLDSLPTAAIAGGAYKSDLGDRVVDQAAGVIQTITFPLYDQRFANADVRAAFSMAIDRGQIINNVFEGTREAATGWVSPVVDGYKANACGENCNFDAAKAKSKLEAGGGFAGDVTIAYNADGDHKAWVDATCVSITNTLGVPCAGKPYVDFKTFRQDVTEKKMTGLFRTGWQMDYPSIENFLVPLYKTGASSNDGGYSNPQFDTLMDEGAAQSGAEGIKKFQDGESVLAADMPVIPLWYGKVIAGYSDKVTNVQFTPFSRVDLTTIELK